MPETTTITGLPNAATLTGSERVPMDQGGSTVDASAQAIANLATKTTVGLGNVDNTSDADKPISSAAAAALGGKAATGSITASGLTMTAGILGRESGTGAPQVYMLGSGLAIVGGAIVATGSGGGISVVLGVSPISVADGTTAPVVSISAATPAAAGSMSAADKAKIDLITVDSASILVKLVRNETGSPIAKGVPVYVTGSSGVTLTVAPADASTEETAARTIGITQNAIADNATGYVVAVGLLDGLNTASLTEGQIIWLSEATGQITSTRPTEPAHGVVMGYCVKQAAGTAGILYVKVDNGLELAELHDVLLTGAVSGQVLSLFPDGLWRPRTLAAVALSGAYADLSGRPLLGTAAPLDVAVSGDASAIQVVRGSDSRLSDAREWTAATATQAEAETGSSTARLAFTPQRIFQAVAAWWQATSSTVGRALATAVDKAAARAALDLGSAATGALATTAPLNHAATAAAGTSGDVARADHAHQFQAETAVIPLSMPTGSVTVGELEAFENPETIVLTAIPRWCVKSAPAGAALQFDIRVGGTSIFSTLPTIAIGGISSSATTPAVFAAAFVSGGQQIAAGAVVTIHCTQQATSGGTGGKVAIYNRRAA